MNLLKLFGCTRRSKENTEKQILEALARIETGQMVSETKNQERHLTLMSAISEYTARVEAKFDEISNSVDGIAAGVTGVTGDVAELKALIEKLQNSPGGITPEDQALLDQTEAKLNATATRLATVKDALAALDAATEPPTAPTA